MKKWITLVLLGACMLILGGCSKVKEEPTSISNEGNTNSFILGELAETENREQISNQIPEWVSEADWDKPLYAVSSSDIEQFDTYAQENFPDYCDAGWTQEQSDSVYLGRGIEMFALGDETQINRIIYYPVILNGVVVGGYQVYQQSGNQEIHMQASSLLANELNTMMGLTNEDTPLILGYNNNNTIGIIGDTYYVLDIDHMEHKAVSADKIPVMEYETCINVMEPFCTERTANIDDWVMWNR